MTAEEPPNDACPACQTADFLTLLRVTDVLFHTTTDSFHVVECSNCRLMRLSPRPCPSELRRYYPPAYYYEPGSDLASRLEERYRRIVLGDHVRFAARAVEEASEKGVVLDVGCGGGLFLRMMRERGYPVAGLDFSLAAAATAWRQNQVPVVCSTLSRPPLAPESCAAITMFHVLEHLYDPVSYLDEARRLLRPAGRLIVQVPNAACWQFLVLGENWNGLDAPRHLIHFRTSHLVSLLEQCGFEVLRKKFFSLRDNPAGLASSLAPGLDPMARRVRGVAESPKRKLFRDLLYFGLVLLAVPVTLMEAACGAGSTVMIEARKKT